jgi:hypothetical protein
MWTYTTRVRPLYYAMLLFRNAVGRRFLPATISGTRGHGVVYRTGKRVGEEYPLHCVQ